MINSDNSQKSKHGNNARQTLDDAISELTKNGAITHVKNAPKYGYKGYQPDQFKAEKEIEFANGKQAVLFSTASLRSDRVRTKQWTAHNIKQISSIESAYIILPDSKSFDGGTTPRDEIREKKVVSAIDDIFTVEEFYEYAMTTLTSNMESGKAHDLTGKTMENLIASVLSNPENLKRYQGASTSTGYMYDLFHTIVCKLNLNPHDIKTITATTSIPLLPNGGNPKTDVAMYVEDTKNDVQEFTFSLKNSSNKTVSVHEYSADSFADVLDKDNAELRRLLNAFQSAGSRSAMNPIDAEALSIALKPYLVKLDKWVFGGYGGQLSSDTQLAQFIITHDKLSNRYAIHSIDEYIDLLESNNTGNKGFGTIYNWTYASKKRGKCIQLKARVLT